MRIEHEKLSICYTGLYFHWKIEKMLPHAQWFISFHPTIQLQEFHPKERIQTVRKVMRMIFFIRSVNVQQQKSSSYSLFRIWNITEA